MLESLHTKMPLMLRFLSDEDDDVSAEMLKSAHDYISLMKICVPLTDQQQASVRVSGRRGQCSAFKVHCHHFHTLIVNIVA